jgi:hypothetical protein
MIKKSFIVLLAVFSIPLAAMEKNEEKIKIRRSMDKRRDSFKGEKKPSFKKKVTIKTQADLITGSAPEPIPALSNLLKRKHDPSLEELIRKHFFLSKTDEINPEFADAVAVTLKELNASNKDDFNLLYNYSDDEQSSDDQDSDNESSYDHRNNQDDDQNSKISRFLTVTPARRIMTEVIKTTNERIFLEKIKNISKKNKANLRDFLICSSWLGILSLGFIASLGPIVAFYY